MYWGAPGPPEPGTEARASGATAAPATFVGAQACRTCHAAEFERWQGSHHALAMQVASEASVRGDFGNRRFTHAGITSSFFRRDGRFMVRTDGPDGQPADFEIKYTFGVTPLQQYLVELPGGRIQALLTAWDARPREAGGQRWFFLYPDQRIDFRDELHWTGRQQNWNHACADCHSTRVRKNYDAASGQYATTWAEINVACEACHGPGSRHVAWAQGAAGRVRSAGPPVDIGLMVDLSERRGVHWSVDPATGDPRRSAPRTSATEIGVCAQCHARRTQISGDYLPGQPFLDSYLPSLLTAPLYWADGQQREEVYTWGSFLQSRMYHAGVTCSDCHDPHGQGLRAPGNQVCTQCHAAARYEAEAHHRHPPDTPGAACVGCHMPPTRYMVIDPRRDHGFRIPRPDLTVAIGVPNACTHCHGDRSHEWADERVRAWYGPVRGGHQRLAEALTAAERRTPGAAAGLVAVARDPGQPGIVRATALAALAPYMAGSSAGLAAARQGAGDADPLVRRAALSALEGLPPMDRIAPAVPLLGDPVLIVRIEAARVLAPVRSDALDEQSRAAYTRAAAAYVAAQRTNADRPESRTNLGSFLAMRGRLGEAEAEFRAAIALDRHFVPAYVNLADAYRAEQREPEVRRVLEEGLAAVPGSAPLHHALGLALVRARRSADAVAQLARAAALAPADARIAYTYAVSLHSTGKPREAIATLEKIAA
ncbi:MAG TPA: multiheme c-type cytochrome, partial [Candidatus Binatia bacterium]|nr:multiheme c-type cytochrome [Candidatus Binatia bacterium]